MIKMPVSENLDDKIIRDIKENQFSTTSKIRRRGIIKNYPYLMKRLKRLANNGRIEFLNYCNRYYVEPLPPHLRIMGIINEQIDQIISQFAKNQKLKKGKFCQEFLEAYKKLNQCKGGKIFKAKKLLNLLLYRYGLNKNFGPDNEQCLRKWFLIFAHKTIIWNLEINKLKTKSSFARNPDDDTLFSAIWLPVRSFEVFLQNYNPSNSESILGIPYVNLAAELDLTYWLDQLYYKELKSNKIPLKVKIYFYHDFLLKGSKKESSRIYLYFKKKSKNYPKHLQKIIGKQKDEKLQQKYKILEQKLTLKLIKEKEKRKNGGEEDEIQRKYQQKLKVAKEEIRNKVYEKYRKKLAKELSDIYPKTRKQITRMIKSLQYKGNRPNIYKMFFHKKIETDRILFGQVTPSDMERVVLLYAIREQISRTPKGSQYDKMQKMVRKELPEMVIA